MNKAGKVVLMTAAFAFAVIPMLSQTSPTAGAAIVMSVTSITMAGTAIVMSVTSITMARAAHSYRARRYDHKNIVFGLTRSLS
jgi:hypothetical protein